MLAAGFILASLLVSVVNAAPGLELAQLSKRQSITALSSSQISAFKPFTFFASTAYCNPSTTINWSCGANCAANSGFIPVASGGDGSSVQFWYVGFSPAQGTVIVAHQGTDTAKIQADATDADAFLESLDSTLFPGVSSSVEAHSGFANEQAKTATQILSAVKSAIAAHSATKVTIVGHSLGAAIALLDGVYLPLHISGVTFRMIGYGMPRVGNQAFADYLDAHLSVTHINNKEDLVPIVPGRFLGYHHPSGEVHIMDNNQWVSCPGQDNPSTECTVGDVPNIFDGSTSDHGGPYDGVTMGC
ncbi:lipase class 3 family protein [Phlegmacium glaucopus]|nr:lipase class 3 family protein [Phlegmacium glaucopus]